MKRDIITKQIGERIRTARKAKKLTQQQLSEKTGIQRSLITRYELGMIEIGMPAFVTICEALNVNYAEILEGIKTE